MLNENRKCETDMTINSHSAKIGGCSLAKRPKSEEFEGVGAPLPDWTHLPSLLLHQTFEYLNRDDLLNAGMVCKNWRLHIFHPKWWPAMTFKIESNEMKRAKFHTNTFGHVVSEATIKVSSLTYECVREFAALLRVLSTNNNLRSLIIEPTHCRFELPPKRIVDDGKYDDLDEMMWSLDECLPRLTKFSIGGLEELSYYLDDILRRLRPKVTHLGLASVKDDPLIYTKQYLNPDLVVPFHNLRVLSMDYDNLSDELLNNLESARSLERLVVHVHGVHQGHAGTSNGAWHRFTESHPDCGLRLTVIHAFKDIHDLHNNVLRPDMPLTHLKVLFCESINMELLELMPLYYKRTLRSLMWIDSIRNSKDSWTFIQLHIPNPLVMAAWLCKQLEELVMYGYKYNADDLMAIGRLRGANLKNLDVPEDDILYSDTSATVLLKDIRKNLGRKWTPHKSSDLHPVICSPLAGDSDEYLLPIVLADLH